MIFNFFRKKPLLKDLIPNKFVDIHSHVLPGLDDGAKTAEESLTLISKMKELGFRKIICTPHTYSGIYDNTKKSICNSYNLIKKSMDLSLHWAERSKKAFGNNPHKALFGIIQGGLFKDLRLKSLEELTNIGFDG